MPRARKQKPIKSVSYQKYYPKKPKPPTPPPSPPSRFFLMSTNAPRAIPGVATCPKGVWVEVPKRVYDGYVIAISEGKKNGIDVGWKVRSE